MLAACPFIRGPLKIRNSRKNQERPQTNYAFLNWAEFAEINAVLDQDGSFV